MYMLTTLSTGLLEQTMVITQIFSNFFHDTVV